MTSPTGQDQVEEPQLPPEPRVLALDDILGHVLRAWYEFRARIEGSERKVVVAGAALVVLLIAGASGLMRTGAGDEDVTSLQGPLPSGTGSSLAAPPTAGPSTIGSALVATGAATAGVPSVSAASGVVVAPPGSSDPKLAATSRGTPPAPAKLGANVPTTGSASFGIAAGSTLPNLSGNDLEQRLQGMVELGVGWVRLDIEWSNVQRVGPDSYDFSDYDRVVKAVIAHRLRPLVILDYTPEWARSGECAGTPFCHPRNPDEFGSYAHAVAARYAGLGVRNWEIWNEPNLSQYYAPKPDPAGYAALLKAAYAGIKSVDAGAVVITGGTAPTQTADDGSTIRSVDFLSAVYDAGAKGSFDAVAQHPYTFPYTPDHAYPGGAWGDLSVLHSIMVAHGDGGKRIWSTEYGAPTDGPGNLVSTDVRQVYPDSSHVSEGLQALIVRDAVTRLRSYPWAGPMFWYSYQDAGTSTSSNENFFGLVRADGSHKPAYDAYQAAIR